MLAWNKISIFKLTCIYFVPGVRIPLFPLQIGLAFLCLRPSILTLLGAFVDVDGGSGFSETGASITFRHTVEQSPVFLIK